MLAPPPMSRVLPWVYPAHAVGEVSDSLTNFRPSGSSARWGWEQIMRIRSQLRLIERAVKQGWPTPLDEQRRSIALVLETLDSPQDFEVRSALRVLAAIIEHEGATDAEIRKRAADALRRYTAR